MAEARQLLGGQPLPDPHVFALPAYIDRARLVDDGRLDEAQVRIGEDLGRRLHSISEEALLLVNRGQLAAARGDLASAATHFEDATQRLSRFHKLDHLPLALVEHAHFALRITDFGRVDALLSDAERIAERGQMLLYAMDCRFARACLALSRRDVSKGLDALHDVLTTAERRGYTALARRARERLATAGGI